MVTSVTIWLKKTLRCLASLLYSHGSGAALRCLHALCVLSTAQAPHSALVFVMDFGAASASGLSMTSGATQQGGPAVLGPDLWEDMGEQAFVEALNAWGSGMHREVLACAPT